MNYNEQIEKVAKVSLKGVAGEVGRQLFKTDNKSFMGRLNTGQKILGAATGAAIGAGVGYQTGKNKSYLEKIKPINSYNEDKANGFSEALGNAKNNYQNEEDWAMGHRAPMHSSLLSDLPQGMGDQARQWAKHNKQDINSMKAKDYLNLVDEVGVNQYYDGTAAELLPSDRKELKNSALKTLLSEGFSEDDLKKYASEIEKKAFLSEALVGGFLAGGAANGIRTGVNKAQELIGPKTKKAKKEYNEFMGDESNKASFDAWSNHGNFVDKQIGEAILTNPDITMGELRSMVNNNYRNELLQNKTAFDIVEDAFEKMAGVEYGHTAYKDKTGGKVMDRLSNASLNQDDWEEYDNAYDAAEEIALKNSFPFSNKAIARIPYSYDVKQEGKNSAADGMIKFMNGEGNEQFSNYKPLVDSYSGDTNTGSFIAGRDSAEAMTDHINSLLTIMPEGTGFDLDAYKKSTDEERALKSKINDMRKQNRESAEPIKNIIKELDGKLGDIHQEKDNTKLLALRPFKNRSFNRKIDELKTEKLKAKEELSNTLSRGISPEMLNNLETVQRNNDNILMNANDTDVINAYKADIENSLKDKDVNFYQWGWH